MDREKLSLKCSTFVPPVSMAGSLQRMVITNATTFRATVLWEPSIPIHKWATEGDTPAFLHVYPNGLNDPDKVDQGGWGGRFELTKKAGIRSMKPVTNEGDYDPYLMFGNSAEGSAAIKRWSTAYDNDFAARMDWSITSKYADANHHPIAIVNGDSSRKVLQVSAAPGSVVALSATGSSDPDEDSLTYSWTFYQEPSSYQGRSKARQSDCCIGDVMIPDNASGETIAHHFGTSRRRQTQPLRLSSRSY